MKIKLIGTISLYTLLVFMGLFAEEKKSKNVQKGSNSKYTGKTITNTIGMTFVQIPAGEFMMGCSENDSECNYLEKPPHKVKITQSFYIGKFEVTQAQWKKVMGENPSEFSGCNNCPVERVSWNDIQEFVDKLNSTTTKGKYRLPTEAEWEYAARAGSTTRYYWGSEINNEYLWYSENSDGNTHPVGKKKPNAFGLYDMLGNVWEWCEDLYENYTNEEGVDPKGATSGCPVLRGGSFREDPRFSRSSLRFSFFPDDRFYLFGFRLVFVP